MCQVICRPRQNQEDVLVEFWLYSVHEMEKTTDAHIEGDPAQVLPPKIKINKTLFK